MKRIRVQLDDRTAEQLEAAVPAGSRKRSAFVRQAIAKALLELQEHRTRTAYERAPDGRALCGKRVRVQLEERSAKRLDAAVTARSTPRTRSFGR